MRVYDKPDLHALRQAMSPFEEEYKVIRHYDEGYDDKGRYQTRDVEDTLKGRLIEHDTNLNINSNGHGEWTSQDFTLVLVYPEFVREGDIVISQQFGKLRVTSAGNYKGGALSAALKRVDSTEYIEKYKGDI